MKQTALMGRKRPAFRQHGRIQCRSVTLLVDLEAHQPVDLIEERSAEVVAQWLKDHPGVEVITRDRSNEYAEGASRGAPDALQVADRFHLLQNMREMLQRLLDGQQEALVAATRIRAIAARLQLSRKTVCT